MDAFATTSLWFMTLPLLALIAHLSASDTLRQSIAHVWSLSQPLIAFYESIMGPVHAPVSVAFLVVAALSALGLSVWLYAMLVMLTRVAIPSLRYAPHCLSDSFLLLPFLFRFVYFFFISISLVYMFLFSWVHIFPSRRQ